MDFMARELVPRTAQALVATALGMTPDDAAGAPSGRLMQPAGARTEAGLAEAAGAAPDRPERTGTATSVVAPSSRGRIRLTRFAALVALPLVVTTPSMWGHGSVAHEILQWLGYAAIIICVLGRVLCTAYIGGRKRVDLVRSGPFSIVRNPLYCFSFVGVVGIGLLTGTLTWPFVFGVAFAAYYNVIVRREEAFLLSRFPVAYREYVATVPRWIPDFRKWRDVEDTAVKPAFVFRSLQEGAWFFVAFPVLEATQRLLAAGLIPSTLPLP